jgi:DNA-binding protein YbaB
VTTKDAVDAAMRRAVEAAAMARENPTAAVLGEFPGENEAGTATVWVDAIGRMVRLELAPGSVMEGDEEGVATAIADAYVEAVRAASVFAHEGLAEWARQHAERPALRPDPDDEADVFQELHEPY